MTKKKQPNATPASTPLVTTKKERVVALLRRQDGATLADITEATAWLPHTARAMLTGLRKQGFDLAKEKVDGTNRYSISAGPAA
jgi:DNA-binding IclR family transcriptional regulator